MSIKLSRKTEKTPGAALKSKGADSWLNKEINLFGNELSLKKKEAFFLEFGVLLRAGLDFKTALDLVTESMATKKKDSFFRDMQANIINGASLAEAMAQSGKFSQYDIYSIKIAEESGRLESITEELSNFYTKSIEHRRQLSSALSYPGIVIVTAILSLSFLLNFLVPMFDGVYKRLNQDLPALTKWIVALSALFSKYTLPFVFSLGVVLLLLYWKRNTRWFRKYSAALLLRIPIIGNLMQLLYLGRFCTAMSFLSMAKVPVLEALSLVKQMIRFYPFEHALEAIGEGVVRGQSLYKGMERFKIFPKRMIALVKVGEEVNQLDKMFERLSRQYDKESEYKIKSLGSLIEPVLIVFLAIIVGVILIAMYLPIFKLVSNFG